MVAVAAGDAEEAQRQARKADVLLAEPPLTLLLSAQAAQLQGDENAAQRYFTEMLARRETEFLGLRGLLTQALKSGDERTALRLAERAHALRPRTPWVLDALLDLQTRRTDWDAADRILGESQKLRLLSGETGRHRRAAVALEQSKAAAGRDGEALKLAAKAQELAPDLAPAAAQHALLLARAGKLRAAAKAIEAAWRRAPHPLLAETYGTIFATETALTRVKRFANLAAANPGHCDSHLAEAEAALAAQLWGETRRHLEAAGAVGSPDDIPDDKLPPARICRLMARLAEAEHGDAALARAWRARAAEAPGDPAYVCGSCGAENASWQPLCPRCRSFDSFTWQVPTRGGPALLPAPEPARVLSQPAPIAGDRTHSFPSPPAGEEGARGVAAGR
jgi:HemY protein